MASWGCTQREEQSRCTASQFTSMTLQQPWLPEWRSCPRTAVPSVSCLKRLWTGTLLLQPCRHRTSFSGHSWVDSSNGATTRPSRTWPVSYTHLRAHETRHDLVCRLLLE